MRQISVDRHLYIFIQFPYEELLFIEAYFITLICQLVSSSHHARGPSLRPSSLLAAVSPVTSKIMIKMIGSSQKKDFFIGKKVLFGRGP